MIENGRVITGDGSVLQEASVVVAGDSIVSVTEGLVEAPDARRIDASGKTVLPGLIDAHVHLTIPPDGRDSTALVNYLDEGLPEALRSFIEHGVTTVRSTGGYWPWAGRVKSRVAAGELSGPRIVTSGPILTTEGGHPSATACSGSLFCRSHVMREVSTPAEARQAVRDLSGEGVDFIKLASDSLLAPVLFSDPVVRSIVDQAHQEGVKATAHAPEVDVIERYAGMGMDGFVHPPSLPSLSRERIRRLSRILRQYDTPVTTTVFVVLAYSERPVQAMLEDGSVGRELVASKARDLAVLGDAGVPLVLGTDWCPCNAGENPAFQPGAVTITEMKGLRWGGMSRHAIVQAATANAARALEMEDRVGTLEADKLADLIVVDGNPLDDLAALEEVEVVVQGGKVLMK